MSLTVPAKYVTPKLHEAVAQTLQTALEGLTWIDKVFAIARQGYSDEHTYPEIYKNDGSEKNIMLLPDTSVDAFSFFTLNNAVTPTEDEQFYVYDMSLIVWFQLAKVDATKAYDFTGEKLIEVINKLKDYSCYDVSYLTEFDQVWGDYSVVMENQGKYRKRTYTQFKINFKYDYVGCT